MTIDTKYTQPGPQMKKIHLKFPTNIKAIDDRTVEIELYCGPSPFTDEFAKTVMCELGEKVGHQFLDELAEHLTRQFIIKGIV